LPDYYKILKIEFGATETEIKKAFRKLATIYHPDKNNGSTQSEEIFKIILNAYETLSDKGKKDEYDTKYKEQFQKKHTQPKSENQNKQPPKTEYRKQTVVKSENNYTFWVLAIIILIIYLINSNKTTSTGNENADFQLEQQESASRPNSGEIKFKK
jgi:DnaJ-class molecular chaperone